MQIRTKGIVLRLVRYGEDGLIADIFTEQCGLVSFLIKVSQGKQQRLRSTLFGPLSILSLTYEFRQKCTLQKIIDASIVLPLQSIPYHPVKSMIVLYLQEFLYYALRREAANNALFQYIVYGMCWLDNCPKAFANFHLVFLMRMTRFMGILPNLDNYSRGMFFDLMEGQFTSQTPFHGACLGCEEASLLPLMARMDFRTMHLFQFNRVQRTRFLEILVTYYRMHIPEFPVLKSQDVLRDTLA